jgi:hypothetical protein
MRRSSWSVPRYGATSDSEETRGADEPRKSQDETGKLDQAGKKQTVNEGVPLPKTVEEASPVVHSLFDAAVMLMPPLPQAQDLITRFQNGAEMSDRDMYV